MRANAKSKGRTFRCLYTIICYKPPVFQIISSFHTSLTKHKLDVTKSVKLLKWMFKNALFIELNTALILQTLMVSEFPAKHDTKYSVLSTYPDQHSCEVALVYTRWLLFYLVVMMITEKLKLLGRPSILNLAHDSFWSCSPFLFPLLHFPFNLYNTRQIHRKNRHPLVLTPNASVTLNVTLPRRRSMQWHFKGQVKCEENDKLI